MLRRYFNYRFDVAEGGWQRRDFANRWWRIYQSDPRWVPPVWTDWLQALARTRVPHLTRMEPILLHGEALPRRVRVTNPHRSDLSAMSSALFEEPVAAGVLLTDPRRRDGTAYVAHLHVENDVESLARFLARAQELLEPDGVRRLILPTGLSPHLGTGVLQDHFHRLPPLHTPYNPPYLPELMATVCRPLGRSLSYEVVVAEHVMGEKPEGTATVRAFEPRRLTADLLPLFRAAVPVWVDFPPLDVAEATFLIEWVERWPLEGWLAEVNGEAVGFVLLQPDVAAVLRLSNGGRRLWWRPWLGWRSRRSFAAGRLLFGGVLPQWRRQGIGRQLWQRALQSAREAGWKTLSIGPLPSTAVANNFLQAQDLEPQRTYLLHRYEFS